MSELSIEELNQRDLAVRQQQFEVLIGMPAGSLQGLCFCETCGGSEYQWADLSFTDLAADGLVPEGDWEEAYEYRQQLIDAMCNACDGTSFEGGSFEMSPREWLDLSSGQLSLLDDTVILNLR